MTRSSLESLSIIAYRQPVTKAEIEHIRGVDSGAVLKTLLSLSMIRILGRKEAPGRPILYGSTREFLEYFGLRDIESLPTLEEVTDLLEEGEGISEEEMRRKGEEGIFEDQIEPEDTSGQELDQKPQLEVNLKTLNNGDGIDVIEDEDKVMDDFD